MRASEREINQFNAAFASAPRVKSSPPKRADPDNSPATPSEEYRMMAPRWDKMSALLGGTETMRARGEYYLPRHEEETDGRYQERLSQNFLLNMTTMSLDRIVGYPFSVPVHVPENFDLKLKSYLDDVDLQGNNLDVFARGWFREGVAKGYAHVLVEFPYIEQTGLRTLEDDNRENVRPYLTLIHPEDLIYAHFEQMFGVEKLVNVRIKETVKARSGFISISEMQIRELNLEHGVVTVNLWRSKKQQGKEEWFLYHTHAYAMDFIPLVTFYSDKQGVMLSKPPLTDMADVNIRHWQSQSDQITSLTAARFPMLAFIGVGEETGKNPRIGPYQGFRLDNPSASVSYVEHSGAALASGVTELVGLEEKMSSYGVQFLNKPQGGVTATGRILDAEELNSPLMDMVIRFEDALNTAFWMLGQWLRYDPKIKLECVAVNRSFGVERISDNDLNTLTTARANKQISHRTYVIELQRRGVLGEEYDFDEDAQLLQIEHDESIAALPTFDIDSAQTDEPIEEENTPIREG